MKFGSKKKDADAIAGTGDGKKRRLRLKLPFTRERIRGYEMLSGMMPLDDEVDRIVDRSGNRFVMWDVRGSDIDDGVVATAWERTVNSIAHPVQFLVRQHLPRLDLVREDLAKARPESMRDGRIGQVADSLLKYLSHIEANDRVVDRRRYVVCREQDLLQANSLMIGSNMVHSELKGDDLRDVYASCFSGLSPHPRLRDDLDMFQAIEYSKYLELRGRYVRCFEFVEYPRVLSPVYLEELFDSGIELDLSMYVWPVSPSEAQSRLRTQLVRWNGQRSDLIQRGRVVPPEVDMVVADVDRLWGEVQRGVSKLFRITLTAAVYGRSVDELDESSEVLESYFRTQMSRVRPMTFRHADGYAMVMPTLKSGGGEPYLTDSGTMMRMYPFSPPDMDTRGGTLFGMDRRSKAPIIFDPFDTAPPRMNGHMVVMARSGAGKSYTTKLRVIREATRGNPVYLIDPDGEYGPIANLMGGRVLVPGRPGYGMNPFATVYTDIGYLSDKCNNLCYLVQVMLQGEVDQEGVAIIDRCVSSFYAQQIRNVLDAGLPLEGQTLGSGGMREFYSFLRQQDAPEGADWLANMIERFAVGSVRFLMASSDEGVSTDLMSDELPVTTFNLRGLPDNLKPVATSVCSEVVWGLAVGKPRPRIMIVDECWTVLSTKQGASMMLAIAKRARKYRLALMAITQDVQDFLAEIEGAGVGGHAGLSLLQNASDKFALSQDDNVFDQVCEVLNLTSNSRQFLRTVGRGQGLLISAGAGQFPVEMVSTAEEHELILDPSWLTDGSELDPKMETRLLRDYLSGNTAQTAEGEDGDGDGGGVQDMLKGALDLSGVDDEYRMPLAASDILAEELSLMVSQERASDDRDFA